MGRYTNLLLSIAGGMLLWFAWPVKPFTFLIFFSFFPLLWLEERTASSYRKFFGYTYLHMLLWNVLTTWWVWNASVMGAVMAFGANSLIMCLPPLLMRFTKRKAGRLAGYTAFVLFWISFEHLHHTWELSWPWLTLGNAFSIQPNWVQWYEYTGSTGGSLWVLLANVLFYNLFTAYRAEGRSRRTLAGMAFLILLLAGPMLLSRSLLSTRTEQIEAAGRRTHKNIVVVQPNVDPYEEKFAAGTQESQIRRLIELSEKGIDSATALVVWPETAIPVGVWEDEIGQNHYYEAVWEFLGRHPRLSLLSGIDSYRNYGSNKENASPTARYNKEQDFYYDAFNTAALLGTGQNPQFYHKAKLVPGVETLPSFLLWLGGLFEDFGGISGTLGRDKQRVVLADKQHYYLAAPVICYESIYSDYITEYVRKGANILTIMTNDGWWDDSPGYKQHMNYGRLRAIETRRWIARSANTGISCFIDPAGNVYEPQPWDTQSSIKMNVSPLQITTFFVRHGDYLSPILSWASALLLLFAVVQAYRRRSTHKKAPHAQTK